MSRPFRHNPISAPLQHGEIIRPFGAGLSFELLVGKDAFLDQELTAASVIANVLTISSSSVTLSDSFRLPFSLQASSSLCGRASVTDSLSFG
jgi:hypothetical protein